MLRQCKEYMEIANHLKLLSFFIMHRYPVSVEERSVRQTTDHVRANQNVRIYLRTTLPYNNTI